MNVDVLDLALGNAEKLYASLRAFHQLCGEISDWQAEAKRAKAEAAQAKRELGKLNAELSLAQSALDKAQSECAQTEKRVSEIRTEHTMLTNDINRIRRMVEAA